MPRHSKCATFLRCIHYIAILLVIFCWSNESTAQDRPQLFGSVNDAETGEPLIGAHAFLGSTMIGTATDLDGRFALDKIPTGTHMLWISMIGYEPASKEISVSDTSSQEVPFTLEPAIIPVGELTVSAKRDKRWKKRLNSFNKMFIGETLLSHDTSILNPEVLDFKSNWLGKFVAYTSEPLIIENRALGYHIEYVLKEFSREGSTIRYDGDPLFKEIEPATPEEADIWEANRLETFNGSFRHFLRALMDGTTEQEGFHVLRVPSVDDISRRERRFRINPKDMIEPGEAPGDLLLSFLGVVEIIYQNERENEEYLKWKGAASYRPKANQTSWIRLTTGPTLIDPSGEIVDPYGVTVYGYYAFERVANDLPKEYLPPSKRPKEARQ